MPELPEVELVKRGLSNLLPGKKIVSVRHDWDKSFPNAAEDVRQFLVGARVVGVNRRAKVLLVELDTKYSLVIHLKMTGQLIFVGGQQKPEVRGLKYEARNQSKTPKSNSLEVENWEMEIAETSERFGGGHPSNSLVNKLPDKSTRIIFDFEDGGKLFFNDQRKFGWVRLLPTAEVPNIDFFQRVGPEPLSADFTQKDFRERIKRRMNTNIKAVLLDQTVIAGAGNIYADESLWAAKIHPSTLVKNLSDQKLNALYKSLQGVLHLAIDKGGSTDRNYVDAEGKKGSYLSYASVFRHEGRPCPRCGTAIIKTRVAGRGTHLCPKCQKK
jgi:formamidopyrimidine-DNA glycosylase